MLLMLVVFCVFGNSTYVEVLTTSVVDLMSFVLIVSAFVLHVG